MRLKNIVKIILMASFYVYVAPAFSAVYEPLNGNETRKILVGKRWFFRMVEPFDITFYRDGTFSMAHQKPCSSGVKNEYMIKSSGQVVFTFKNCNGRTRVRWYHTIERKGADYYLRDQWGTGHFKLRRR